MSPAARRYVVALLALLVVAERSPQARRYQRRMMAWLLALGVAVAAIPAVPAALVR